MCAYEFRTIEPGDHQHEHQHAQQRDGKHVDQELIDMFSISGSKEHMVDRFDLLAEIGLTEVVLGPPFSGNWREATEEIFKEISSRR